MSDATGAVATRSYSNMCIVGEDGHKIETATPRGIDVQPTNVTGVTIDGISQFEGLVNEGKILAYTAVGNLITWDGGTPVNIFEDGEYSLYDSDDNNMLLITVVFISLPTDNQSDTITTQNGVLADQVTVLQLDDELLTAAPAITDANSVVCAAAPASEYPRPGTASEYAIYADDKSLIAIKNVAGSDDLSVDYSIYKIARPYTSLTAVDADHKSDTEISKTAAKMFANGAGTVSVMNCWDGSAKNYAACLSELETQGYDYDIMVATIDCDDGDGNFDLCATHAITYNKIIIAPKIGTVTVVRASWGTLTLDEGQYGICHDTATYSVGELSGAAAAAIAKCKPWNPCEWVNISGINTAGYSRDDLVTIEGTYSTMGGNTFIAPGANTVLSSGRGLKAGSFVDIPRTKTYLKDATQDAWVTAKLVLANSNKKIPYTAAGLVQVKNILRKPLMKAQRDGALRETSFEADGTEMPGFIINMPSIEDIPLAYKSARQLPDVAITAYLSGAISTINPLYFTVSLGEV